jgi:hypothetical protein
MDKQELAQKLYDFFYDCDEIELDSFIGVRALTAEEPETGELWNSHIWEDGENTGVELDGTSAIQMNPYETNLSENDALRAAEYVMVYTDPRNPRYAVIIGDYATGGEDAGEVIIRNARILKVF